MTHEKLSQAVHEAAREAWTLWTEPYAQGMKAATRWQEQGGVTATQWLEQGIEWQRASLKATRDWWAVTAGLQESTRKSAVEQLHKIVGLVEETVVEPWGEAVAAWRTRAARD